MSIFTDDDPESEDLFDTLDLQPSDLNQICPILTRKLCI